MSGKTKNQHFIPQFYLKYFTDDNERFAVLDVKKNTILTRQRPRNFAAKRYFYDLKPAELKFVLAEILLARPEIEQNIDWHDEQCLEHYFANAESDAKKVIDLIISDSNNLWVKEIQEKIIIFLHDLSIRTELLQKQCEHINKTTNSHLQRLRPSYVDSDACRDAKISQLHQLMGVGSLQNTAEKLMLGYDWFIGENISDISFIIGDDPARNIFLGFADICFPISRKKAIIFRAKDTGKSLLSKEHSKNGKTIELSLESVLMYNSLQLAYSYRYCFGDKLTFLALQYAQKITNVDLMPNRNF